MEMYIWWLIVVPFCDSEDSPSFGTKQSSVMWPGWNVNMCNVTVFVADTEMECNSVSIFWCEDWLRHEGGLDVGSWRRHRLRHLGNVRTGTSDGSMLHKCLQSKWSCFHWESCVDEPGTHFLDHTASVWSITKSNRIGWLIWSKSAILDTLKYSKIKIRLLSILKWPDS